jgi:hypothetical protein
VGPLLYVFLLEMAGIAGETNDGGNEWVVAGDGGRGEEPERVSHISAVFQYSTTTRVGLKLIKP